MRVSKAHRDAIDHRRARVAELRLERRTEREIAAVLAAEGIRNPDTDEPWTHVTVHADCAALAATWRREALGNTDRRTAEVWAELRHVRRRAWEANDFTAVLRALKQEAELLGLDAPTRVDILALIRLDAERAGLDPDEMVRVAEQVIRDTRS